MGDVLVGVAPATGSGDVCSHDVRIVHEKWYLAI